ATRGAIAMRKSPMTTTDPVCQHERGRTETLLAETVGDLCPFNLSPEALRFAGASQVQGRAAAAVIRFADPHSTEEQLSDLSEWLGAREEHREQFARLFNRWCITAAGGASQARRPSSDADLWQSNTPVRGPALLNVALVCRDLLYRRLKSYTSDC